MLTVRRVLTEILLEVTTQEISAVCSEVWSRARGKGTPDIHDRTNQSNFYTFARRHAKSDSMRLLAPQYDEAIRLCNTKLKTLNRNSLMHRLNYSGNFKEPPIALFFYIFRNLCIL